MIRLSYAVRSPLPLDEAFARVADFGRLAEWDPGVAGVTRLTDGPTATGTRFRLVARFLGGNVEMEYELIDWAPPLLARYVGRTRRVTSQDEIRAEAGPRGTVLTLTAAVSTSGALRAVEPLLGLAMRWQGRHSLRALRDHVAG